MKTQSISLTLAALMLLASCQKKDSVVTGPDIIPAKSQRVLTQNYARPVVAAGIITSEKEARLSFKVAGVIHALHFNEGDHVAKGQLMATLYQTETSAQLQRAKSAYEKEQKRQRRIQKLRDDNAATDEELESSFSDMIAAKQAFDIAQFNARYSAIYASQSGTVIKKHMNEDEIADIGQAIYTINAAGRNDWVIKIGLSDRNWASIRKGDSATVTTDAYTDEEFAARVSEIGTAADPITGTFLVKLKVNPGSRTFANGLAAKVSISPSQKKKLVFIPTSAIVEANENTAVVYVPNADRITVTPHKVRIAFIENSRVAISAGLENIKDIITDGAPYLSADSKIKL